MSLFYNLVDIFEKIQLKKSHYSLPPADTSQELKHPILFIFSLWTVSYLIFPLVILFYLSFIDIPYKITGLIFLYVFGFFYLLFKSAYNTAEKRVSMRKKTVEAADRWSDSSSADFEKIYSGSWEPPSRYKDRDYNGSRGWR